MGRQAVKVKLQLGFLLFSRQKPCGHCLGNFVLLRHVGI